MDLVKSHLMFAVREEVSSCDTRDLLMRSRGDVDENFMFSEEANLLPVLITGGRVTGKDHGVE